LPFAVWTAAASGGFKGAVPEISAAPAVNRRRAASVMPATSPAAEEHAMPVDPDAVLLETVTTHRSRLQSAFLYGQLGERRPVNDNVKRVVGSTLLAAVACAGCVGFAVVAGFLADRDAVPAGPAPAPVPAAQASAVGRGGPR
jgi:hypothetical protein